MPELRDEESIQQLISLLQQIPVFGELPEVTADLARRAEFSVFEQGTQIINQGDDKADTFFVVMSGQLRAIDVGHDPPRLLNYHPPGSIVGTRAFLGDGIRAATVEVVIDAKLAVFHKRDWDWLISLNDRIETYFRNLEREFDKPDLVEFPGQQWDEAIVISTKRHLLALLARLPLALTILIAPVLFLIGAELLNITVLTLSRGEIILIVLAAIPFVVLAVVLMVYYYLDWRNDDFIVTTKRVVHIERVLLYGEQRDEAPLTRIQDVTVISFDLISRFFDYHDLEVKTAGAGTIYIYGIPTANKIREIIFRERERAMARVSAADLAAIRQMIARRLDWESTLKRPVMAVAEEEGRITTPDVTRRLPGALDYLWPRVREVKEEKDETVVIWRKHLYILIIAIFMPVIAFLVSLFLFVASLFAWPPFGVALAIAPVQIMLALAMLASLLWYSWRYDGWRVDLYMVTNTRIVDIEGSPFRLRGEQRREGTFDNVQNITYDIPNLFCQLLNLGDVVIETAGTERTFTFKQVFNPSGIQEEIFNRMAIFQQRQRESTRDSTTNRLVEVIKEYHYLHEKAMHQRTRQ
jgi:membrane protein YdbS with pleckstrin-like domain